MKREDRSPAESDIDSLHRYYRDPPDLYRPCLLWWWVSEINLERARWEIDELMRRGVRSAIVYPARGMFPHFLSEEWWVVWQELLPHAKEKGFTIGVVPEYFHPQGDARDVSLDPPDQSHVLLGHPEYRLKRLTFTEKVFSGPGKCRFDGLGDAVIAVAGKKLGPNALDAESLIDLSSTIQGGSFEAELTVGEWVLTFYTPVKYTGPLNIRVDPLNAEATDRYIDLTLGEFSRRFPEHMGSTFKYVLLDSEGGFGGPLVWTPEFFSRFEGKYGYDVRRLLPLLVYDGGDITPKVRYDYFQTITDLFVDNYWKRITDWCENQGLKTIQQSWGDNILMDAKHGGDFMACQRAMSYPFMEDLSEWHHDPRQFKEVSAIANFEGKPMWAECQLLQGRESYISPQKIRAGTNLIGAWGVAIQSPEFAHNRGPAGAPMWGPEQPHWGFFNHYTDLMRRIGAVNAGGRHVADILLYKPLATVVAATANAAVEETGNFDDVDNMLALKDLGAQFGAEVERAYGGFMKELAATQKDFDVVDDYYLEKATLKGGRLRFAGHSFRVIILPMTKVVGRRSLQKIRRFFEEGGVVIAYGMLPAGSIEQGWNDSEVTADVHSIFGVGADCGDDAENDHPSGGRAFFVRYGLEKAVAIIDRVRQPDFQVLDGSAHQLVYSHREIEGRDIYWVANDTPIPRKLVASLAACGKPERWDAASGEVCDLVYWHRGERTEVLIELTAWDGFHIAFRPSRERSGVSISASRTNFTIGSIEGNTVRGRGPASEREFRAEGRYLDRPFRIAQVNTEPVEAQTISPHGWTFTPTAERLPMRYAREMVVAEGTGCDAGFAEASYNDRTWPLNLLSAERFTIRQWWLIGPFPNPDRDGFNVAFPPERNSPKESLDDIIGEGLEGRSLTWRWHHSRTPWVNMGEWLGCAGRPAVHYAFTFFFSSSARPATAVAEVTNGKVWFNGELAYSLHAQYPQTSRIPIRLEAGWNQVLVKEAPGFPLFRSTFSLYLEDESGRPLENLLVASEPGDPQRLRDRIEQTPRRSTPRFVPCWPKEEHRSGAVESTKGRERWYRIDVPPGSRALLLPAASRVRAIYFNGRKMAADRDGRMALPRLDWDQPNVIALEMAAGHQLPGYATFESGANKYRLGSWTWTGLTYYSGEVVYEKEFELDPRLEGRNVELDLGQVGVTAEVWLNERKVGVRVWQPFRFEVTDFLQPSVNRLRVAVTNSDANSRAEASLDRYLVYNRDIKKVEPPLMDAIDLNGLIGPVRLVPFDEIELSIPRA